jgi:hypothetical protein
MNRRRVLGFLGALLAPLSLLGCKSEVGLRLAARPDLHEHEHDKGERRPRGFTGTRSVVLGVEPGPGGTMTLLMTTEVWEDGRLIISEPSPAPPFPPVK